MTATPTVEPAADALSAYAAVRDSLLSLVGDTPCIPAPGADDLYLKLEGFNPTWSIADRLLLHAVVEGHELSVNDSPEVCASTALLGVVLALPVRFDCSHDDRPFTLLAEAFGAVRTPGCGTTVLFDRRAALETLVRELASEVDDLAEVALPGFSPLRCELDRVDDVRVRWVGAPRDGGESQRRLAARGVLVDRDSAAALAALEPEQGRITAFVAQADGAVDATAEGVRPPTAGE